jgi:hypothetical protein
VKRRVVDVTGETWWSWHLAQIMHRHGALLPGEWLTAITAMVVGATARRSLPCEALASRDPGQVTTENGSSFSALSIHQRMRAEMMR